jgi:hypothetical protein
MARFLLQAPLVVGAKKLKAGTTIADSVGNALPGDLVWTGLTSSTVNGQMNPLDGAATTMKNASVWAGVPMPCSISGANSIDG